MRGFVRAASSSGVGRLSAKGQILNILDFMVSVTYCLAVCFFTFL